MILVDNFKIVLLLGLVICSIGIAPSSALMCKKTDGDDTCPEGKDLCKADATGLVGCADAAGCTDAVAPDEKAVCSAAACCCKADKCNDPSGTNKDALCNAFKTLPGCGDGVTDSSGGGGETTPANGTASSLFENYYGGFPLVTLVSASMYYVPLKSLV